jgi:sugar lactone lactonase YvrE
MNFLTRNLFFKVLWVSIFFISCDKVDGPGGASISEITITALKPTHGPYDTIDTLIGNGFDKIPDIDSVLLNGKKITLISRSPQQVIVKIPSLAGTGPVDIFYQGKVIHGPVFTYDSLLMVTTIAGGIQAGAIDAQGLDARFNQLRGIAVDGSGNVYVSDMNNATIRKIKPQGVVTTLAGANGMTGYVDGTGSAARFGRPTGLCIGANGFLYVGDQDTYRVRKVSLSGVVTTHAGITWNTGPAGGQIDGNISVATFNTPTGIATDNNNNIYVADLNNNKIRKIAGNTVTTVAGGDYYHYGYMDGAASTSLFFGPQSLAVDPFGNLYVIDDGNHRLRKISSSGTVSTLFGIMEPALTGTSTLFSSSALAVDQLGNLFFAIPGGIVKRSAAGTITRYAMGGIGELDGPAQVASYRYIGGIAIGSNGTLYITDNNRVRKIEWQ